MDLGLTGIKLPFSLADVVGGAMDLIGTVPGFIVAVLLFYFAQKVIDLIIYSFRVGRAVNRRYGKSATKAAYDEFVFHTKYKFSKEFREGR